MVTVEEVKETVQRLKIKYWSPRRCSICNLPLHFIFQNEKIFFDASCDCTMRLEPPTERSYSDFISMFNVQTNQNLWENFKTKSVKDGN